MVVETVIRNGRLVTGNETFDADISIDDGKITAVGDRESLPPAKEEIDATGNLVFPGIVDPHVHLEDLFASDTYETGSKAAALGGVTTFIDFAWQGWISEETPWNTSDELPTLTEAIEDKQTKGEASVIDFGLHAGITRENSSALDDLPDIIDEGVSSVKMFTSGSLGLSYGFMNEVFDRVATLDGVAVLHTEDPSVCEALAEKLKAEGKGEAVHFPRSRPDYAEAMAADNAVRMAVENECKYYGIHTSCKEAADVLKGFRDRHGEGLVRAETCTHYTTLTEEVYEDVGTLALIKPPIRKSEDVDSMHEHIRDGTLDVVSTDHNSYTKDDKTAKNWWDVPFGAGSIQYSLPVFHDEAVNKRGLSYNRLVQVMSTYPAKIFGLPQKGTLQPGTDADLVIFDPAEEFTIRAENNASIADYSMYDRRQVTGKVKQTFVRGELVVDDSSIDVEPGHGEFVERERPNWDF